jgi:hypothetical protein
VAALVDAGLRAACTVRTGTHRRLRASTSTVARRWVPITRRAALLALSVVAHGCLSPFRCSCKGYGYPRMSLGRTPFENNSSICISSSGMCCEPRSAWPALHQRNRSSGLARPRDRRVAAPRGCDNTLGDHSVQSRLCPHRGEPTQRQCTTCICKVIPGAGPMTSMGWSARRP